MKSYISNDILTKVKEFLDKTQDQRTLDLIAEELSDKQADLITFIFEYNDLFDESIDLLFYMLFFILKAFESTTLNIAAIPYKLIKKIHSTITNEEGALLNHNFFNQLEPELWDYFCSSTRHAIDNQIWDEDQVEKAAAITATVIVAFNGACTDAQIKHNAKKN